jgi:hypothetical protein
VYEFLDKLVVVDQMIYYHLWVISVEILNLIGMMKRKMWIVLQQVLIVYENVVLSVQHLVDHHWILVVLLMMMIIDLYSRRMNSMTRKKIVFTIIYFIGCSSRIITD